VTVSPARLEPIFSPRPWGVLSLAPFFPEKSTLTEPIGEAWMTGNECVFAGGPFAGRKLGEAWPDMPAEWAGTSVRRGGIFPLLIKFIFAGEKLSVQVHPDDDYASKHEAAAGGVGKTEMWYTVKARPGAEVLAGLKPGVTAEQFRKAIADGTAEEWLEHVPMKEGEAIFIPARTAHTIGAGLVICEIQQHSDLTYRVFDYNRRDARGRSRELHIDKAMHVMRFGEQTCGKTENAILETNAAAGTFLVICRYFATEKWKFSREVSLTTSPEHFELLISIEGSGEIHSKSGSLKYGPAQAWLMPAALGEYWLKAESPTTLLRTYPPGESKDFEKLLAGRGVKKEHWPRLIR
jgi:mannose-6-phosphate isomerase